MVFTKGFSFGIDKAQKYGFTERPNFGNIEVLKLGFTKGFSFGIDKAQNYGFTKRPNFGHNLLTAWGVGYGNQEREREVYGKAMCGVKVIVSKRSSYRKN